MANRRLWRQIVLGFGSSPFHVFELLFFGDLAPLWLWCPWRASRMMSSGTVLRLDSFHRTLGHFCASESQEPHAQIVQNGDFLPWASSHCRNLVQKDKFWRVVLHLIFPTALWICILDVGLVFCTLLTSFYPHREVPHMGRGSCIFQGCCLEVASLYSSSKESSAGWLQPWRRL